MQGSPDDRLGQEDSDRRGGLVLDHKAIIAVVLFVILGTLAVYIGFQTLPAPKSTVMEPMLGMANGKMDSMSGMSSGNMKAMPTMTAGTSHSMPGMGDGSTHSMPTMGAGKATKAASDNASTLEEVRVYFRDNFSSEAPYVMIADYAVDGTSLTIQTNIKGMDAAAMQSGQHICDFARQLVMHGGTAIERYQVLNRSGDKLCGGR